jgi:orotidine-5'-phosphate decarboxylase
VNKDLNPIFCALDTPDLNHAEKLANSLCEYVCGFKLGLEFFLAHGVAGYKRIAATRAPLFLDLKLHDIPNTVAAAVKSLLPLNPDSLTLHASGGKAMMEATVAAVRGNEKEKPKFPKLYGVTVLTSLDGNDLEAVGQPNNAKQQVIRLAKLAQESGLDGIVCSAQEAKAVRETCMPGLMFMVPGIRPSWAPGNNDQKRVVTPRQAVDAGATYIVVGRPITAAENPVDATKRILEEVE